MPKIIVKSRRESFRRAGFEFTRAGRELDTEELSKDQLQAIEDEPQLVVAPATAEGGESKAPAKKPAAKGRK